MRVILASMSDEENQILKKKFEDLEKIFGPLEFFSGNPHQALYKADRECSMVVINLQHFRSGQSEMIKQFRSKGYLGPILIIARPYSPDVFKECEAYENVSMLERPYEQKDLMGIAVKFLRTRQVKQRIFRRYNTNQTAEVEHFTKESKCMTKVQNLSKGGAYIESPHDFDCQVGEILRLNIMLNELDRQHVVPARIVWKRPGEQGTLGIGVEFIKSDEIYKYLMADVN